MSLTLTDKKQPIKIGFEYEGVIKDPYNKIVLYEEISPSAKKNIINNYHTNIFSDKSPTDRYSCLAEIKTIPIGICKDHPNMKILLEELFNEIIYMSDLFHKNGYHIDWGENDIPDETHLLIVSMMDKNIEVTIDSLNSKKVYTIENDKVIMFKSKDNRRRGGGLHINISGIEDRVDINFIKHIHSTMSIHTSKRMRSVYRSNLLFREKRIDGNYVFEYMSFGLQIPNRFNLLSFWNTIKHQYHWCDALLTSLL